MNVSIHREVVLCCGLQMVSREKNWAAEERGDVE